MKETKTPQSNHTPSQLIDENASLRAQNDILKSELQKCQAMTAAFAAKAKNSEGWDDLVRQHNEWFTVSVSNKSLKGPLA